MSRHICNVNIQTSGHNASTRVIGSKSCCRRSLIPSTASACHRARSNGLRRSKDSSPTRRPKQPALPRRRHAASELFGYSRAQTSPNWQAFGLFGLCGYQQLRSGAGWTCASRASQRSAAFGVFGRFGYSTACLPTRLVRGRWTWASSRFTKSCRGIGDSCHVARAGHAARGGLLGVRLGYESRPSQEPRVLLRRRGHVSDERCFGPHESSKEIATNAKNVQRCMGPLPT